MQKPVQIYTLSTCIHCKKAKKFLNDCAVSYEFTDVDLLPEDEKNRVIEEMKELSARCAFPTLVIGDKVIVGFKQDEIREALRLD